jgi:hypothetical protein
MIHILEILIRLKRNKKMSLFLIFKDTIYLYFFVEMNFSGVFTFAKIYLH